MIQSWTTLVAISAEVPEASKIRLGSGGAGGTRTYLVEFLGSEKFRGSGGTRTEIVAMSEKYVHKRWVYKRKIKGAVRYALSSPVPSLGRFGRLSQR
jgi:hypothetical protein